MQKSQSELSYSARPLVVGNDRLARVIEATIAAVEEETAVLKQRDTTELPRLTEKKGQALVNLTRSLQSEGSRDVLISVQHLMHHLRGALVENRRWLQLQIDAVSAVALMITRAVEADRSDGTYGLHNVYGDV